MIRIAPMLTFAALVFGGFATAWADESASVEPQVQKIVMPSAADVQMIAEAALKDRDSQVAGCRWRGWGCGYGYGYASYPYAYSYSYRPALSLYYAPAYYAPVVYAPRVCAPRYYYSYAAPVYSYAYYAPSYVAYPSYSAYPVYSYAAYAPPPVVQYRGCYYW